MGIIEMSAQLNILLKNLVYLFILAYPLATAKQIYEQWDKNNILKEYEKPNINDLQFWVLDTREELQERGVKI